MTDSEPSLRSNSLASPDHVVLSKLEPITPTMTDEASPHIATLSSTVSHSAGIHMELISAVPDEIAASCELAEEPVGIGTSGNDSMKASTSNPSRALAHSESEIVGAKVG
jgi:hypothetical protein